ncbi:DUF805 domain-containing protein [Leucobacter luti]|uniref:Uncharacterized membrane protein YhaH (DUF805 family) n=1 Tax=Leucobacter luti TaxID=340320 RepID=A0A4Q7U099_9MICO|nr:DUF805 domain-containing protein [Leucobacter luti]MBL3698918.1 DUF805 domain-containing protein [Leucobacter luti]RZT66297.1 uncharacterized membrane protein YhaH (DUF805 family) [Leucobacter luti]
MTLPPNPSDPAANQPPSGADTPAPAQPQAPGPEQPAAPQYAQPQQPAPQYAQPQYAQPQYAQPQYAQPQYAQPQYSAPQQPQPQTWAPPYAPEPGPGEPFDGATDPADIERPLYGATFGQAIARFFRGYAKFSGRASRSEYWWAMLFAGLTRIACLILMGIGAIVGAAWEQNQPYSASYSGGQDFTRSGPEGITDYAPAAFLFFAGVILFVIVGLGLLLPSLAISWRRLHDGNFAGPLWFISLVPYGGIAVFVLTLLRSKPTGRRFDTPRAWPASA